MTEIEKKALALVNATFLEPHYEDWAQVPQGCVSKALIRAIERHEAFAQEVSEAAEQAIAFLGRQSEKQPRGRLAIALARFIIPKPDPLVEVMNEMGFGMSKTAAEEFRTAMQARGYEWRKIGEGA